MSPNQPKTPLRAIRIDDELWTAVKEKAEAEGRNVSEIIRAALRRYLRR